MASILIRSLLAALLFAETTLSLQVSSNSPCTSLCLDPGQNTTSPSISNTLGSEITCVDKDYDSTPNGQRFMACVNCLQTSTASDDNGSDQEWFLCKSLCKVTRTTLILFNQIIYVLLWTRVCLDFNSHLTSFRPHVPRMDRVSRFSVRSRMATSFPPTRLNILTVQRIATPFWELLSMNVEHV